MTTDEAPPTRLREAIKTIARSLLPVGDRRGRPDSGLVNAYGLSMRRESHGALPVFGVLALALHLLAFLIVFPGLPPRPREPEAELRVLTLRPYRPPPPPPPMREHPAIERPVMRRIPVPDPTPLELEPIIEPARLESYSADDLEFAPIMLGQPEPPPDIVHIVGVGGVSNPELIASTRVAPAYPELARNARLEGKVSLEAVVRRNGTVDGLEVLEDPAPDLGFADAAVDAVRQWRYVPGRLDGRPVDVMITIVITFSLR